MNIDKLKEMSKKDLVALARESGIPVDGRATTDSILAAIAANLQAYATQPVVNQEGPEATFKDKKRETYFCSREEIEAVIPNGVNVQWHDDDSFTISCRGVTESLTQHQSMTVIKRRIQIATKGAVIPQFTKDGSLKEGKHWDKVSA